MKAIEKAAVVLLGRRWPLLVPPANVPAMPLKARPHSPARGPLSHDGQMGRRIKIHPGVRIDVRPGAGKDGRCPDGMADFGMVSARSIPRSQGGAFAVAKDGVVHGPARNLLLREILKRG
jgi:hypothetical protein